MATRIPFLDMLDPDASPELRNATDTMLWRIAALRRQRVEGAIAPSDDVPTSPGLLETTTEPWVSSSEIPSDTGAIKSIFSTVQEAIITIREQEIAISEQLEAMWPEFAATMPGLFDENLTPEAREEVIWSIKRQEANWDNLKPAEIIVSDAEKAIWGSFIETAKKSDFMNRKSIESLQRGEILELTIRGFEYFKILKIRTKDKQGWAMCVVELLESTPIGKQSAKKGKAHYFISLPLIEWGKLMLINQNTERPYPMSWKIEAMSINRKHHSLIKSFFDLFA